MRFISNNIAPAFSNQSTKVIVLAGSLLLLASFFVFFMNQLQLEQWAQAIEDNLKEQAKPKKLQSVLSPPDTLELTRIALPRLPEVNIPFEEPIHTQKSNEPENKEASNTLNVKQPNQQKTVTFTTEKIYRKITSGKYTDIQIAWPSARTERNQLFEFLYQCAGMKFGTLDKGVVTLAPSTDLAAFAQPSTPYSDWLRIAQGELAPLEGYWLNKHKLQGLPVRLLPKSLDWQLAKHVSFALGKSELAQLRASYKFSKGRLSFVDIELNGNRLNLPWLITTQRC